MNATPFGMSQARLRRIRSLKPAQTLRMCAYCGELVPHSDEHVDLNLNDLETGAALTLFWHGECAAVDPHHLRLADLDAEDPATDGHNERFTVALADTIMANRERLGADGLRGALHIKRDLHNGKPLRNPRAWGFVSRL